MRRLVLLLALATLAAGLPSAAFADAPTCELDWFNYEPGENGGEWGMLAPPGWDEGEPTLSPPVQSNTIESIKFEENSGLNAGFLFIPPDPHCAVGPDHLVTIVNCAIQWYPKAGGAPENQQPLGKQTAAVVNSFFNSLNPANALFDPKVLWDQYDNRFVVVALEQVGSPTTSRVLLAVSDDADPNGTWYFHAINTKTVISGQETWFDYPGIALDDDVIYLTGNMFNFPGTAGFGSRQWIVNKNPFYSGGAATLNPGSPFDAAAAIGYPNSTMMPTHMFGTAPGNVGTWLVLYSGLNDGTNEYLQMIRIDNPTGVPSFVGQQLFLGNIDTVVGAIPLGPQPGSTAQAATQIANNDRRALQAIWQDGHLYTVFHVNPPAPSPDNGQCTAHWVKVQIDTNPGVLIDQGDISGNDVTPNAFTNFPSIAVDRVGNIAIGVGIGSSTFFTSAAYTTHNIGDPAGFTSPLTVYASGLAYYKRTFSSSTTARNRWGDYTGTVIDPDGCIFWSYNEYAGTQGTTTTVGGVSENGRWWTRAVSYYVDDNGNGFSDGCEPVAVVLSRFEAVRDANDAVVRWTVAEEHDHLGFNLYRETDGGARVILHEGLLTGLAEYEFRDEDAPAGRATYWLQEVDRSGRSTWIGSIQLEAADARLGIAQILGATPNPFHQATAINYSLGTSGAVNLSVFDIQGRKVATLVDGVQDAGAYTATWNGRGDNGSMLSSGLYFVKMQTVGQIQNIKVLLSQTGAER